MKKIIKKVIIFALSLISLNTSILSEILQPKHNLQLSIDFARFFGDEERIFLETYYSIRTDEITYVFDNDKYVGGVNIFLQIREKESIIEAQEWTVPSVEVDTNIIKVGKTLVGLKAFFLKPGNYSISIVAVDFNNPERKDSLYYPLQVAQFPDDRDAISDIELCSSIKQIPKDDNNIFYKNTLEVIPNASLLYGSGLPIIYYYFEAYNLLNEPKTENYIVRTSIIDAFGKEVFFAEKSKNRKNNSSVEVGTVNTTTLKGGTYVFKAEILDTVKKTAAVAAKRFFVYKPSQSDSLVTLSGGAFVTGEYAVMSEDEIKYEFEVASYISTEAEKKQFSNLVELDAKRKFLYDFWKRRDIDPMTQENEFKTEYMKRVSYANENFTSAFRKGWNTDRGRVYIVYGPPDDIERYPSSYDAEPYEIWNYNSLQNGVIFIFIDRTGQGDYRLVHSNHRNELQDETWYSKIKKAR